MGVGCRFADFYRMTPEKFNPTEPVDELDLTAHIVAEDPRYPILCINGRFIYGCKIDPVTGDIDPKRICICAAKSRDECVCTL